jgi:hypothetical protein
MMMSLVLLSSVPYRRRSIYTYCDASGEKLDEASPLRAGRTNVVRWSDVRKSEEKKPSIPRCDVYRRRSPSNTTMSNRYNIIHNIKHGAETAMLQTLKTRPLK